MKKALSTHGILNYMLTSKIFKFLIREENVADVGKGSHSL
jgi:hypothetical protein